MISRLLKRNLFQFTHTPCRTPYRTLYHYTSTLGLRSYHKQADELFLIKRFKTDNKQPKLDIKKQDTFPIKPQSKTSILKAIRNSLVFSLKRQRRWTSDDIFALLSWLFLSHTFFLLVGTTTFISLLLIILNSLQFQELIAYFVGKYITSQLNATVIFDSAIIPNLREGTILFKDINLSKSSTNEGDVESHYYYKSQIPPKNDIEDPDIDYTTVNYTLFNLTMKEVKIKLSLLNFLFGKGLIQSAELKGVRGNIDKRYVDYNIEEGLKINPEDPDIVIDGLKVSDCCIKMIYKNYREIKIDVFNGYCKHFRKNWLVYDILRAESINGMYDNCLFSLHKLETLDSKLHSSSHLKIDNLPIDLFNYAATGPLGWITHGTIDVNAVIQLPIELSKSFLGDLKYFSKQHIHSFGIPQELEDFGYSQMTETNKLFITLNLRMKDLRAELPTKMQTIFGWNTLARPIVSFINNHHTNISVTCPFTMDIKEFEGGWTVYNCGLVDHISKAAGYGVLKLYHDERLRSTKLKRLGIWSLGEVSRSFLKLFDYIRGRQEWYTNKQLVY